MPKKVSKPTVKKAAVKTPKVAVKKPSGSNPVAKNLKANKPKTIPNKKKSAKPSFSAE